MHPIDFLNRHMACESASRKHKWTRYYEPVEGMSDDLPAPILGVMLLIWQLRDADLQQKFPLRSTESRRAFLTWCVCHGRNEYKALAEASDFWNLVSAKASWHIPLPEPDPGNAISTFMLLLKEARKDLPFDLGKSAGRAEFVLWYLIHGRQEQGITAEPMPAWQRAFFDAPGSVQGLNCLQMIVYEARADLRAAFPLPAMKDQYIAWYNIHFLDANMRTQLQLTAHDTGAVALKPKLSKGVNVIGYAFGQLGIGEDARMATKSLIAAQVNTALINFLPGKNIPQNDRSMAEFVCDDIVHDINVFCLTALETGRYFAEQGARHFTSTYKIGYWPWELEDWPSEWKHLFSLVDEVWASSMHTYKAIFSYSSVPVKHVPMAVTLPEASKLTRADFGLPSHAKLFLFSFDLNSTAKRKNPTACVDAFLRAFPKESEKQYPDVGLVIKAHPPTQHSADWDRLLELRDTDSRIHIIESTLSKEDLLALYEACDCFISLHRAEGFGRNIAEAMLLGTPVIVTAYSGNMDYTNHVNSYPADYRLVPLEINDYPYGEGKSWAEADIDHAAENMRAVFNYPDQCRLRAVRAQQLICDRYNLHTIGARYRHELQM